MSFFINMSLSDEFVLVVLDFAMPSVNGERGHDG
jgi:hypothetical protein